MKQLKSSLLKMGHFTVKFLLLLSVHIHLSSAGESDLEHGLCERLFIRVLHTFTLITFCGKLYRRAYIYTAVTPGINFPEFTAVGLVDGEQIDYYDSDIRKMILKTEWMEKIDADDPDYCNRNTQNLQRAQEVFKVDVGALMQRFNQTDGVHTVQWMYGCELHDDGTRRGYMQYGYDGEDFISLDLNLDCSQSESCYNQTEVGEDE
ncbi:hypothetical protein SRHO_G00258300 [Serrasalmus rhombeus]